MHRVLDQLERVLQRLGDAALLLLACSVCMQVVARYVFSFSPVWSEEISRLLLIWTVMCGAAISVRHRMHIRVEVLLAPLPASIRRAWLRLLDWLTLVLFVVLVWNGVDAVNFNRGMQSPGLQWPMSILIAAVPVGFAAATLFLAERIWRRSDGDAA